MNVKLLTEHRLEILSLKEVAQARLSLHLSKCHIVGNHMSRLILVFVSFEHVTITTYDNNNKYFKLSTVLPAKSDSEVKFFHIAIRDL